MNHKASEPGNNYTALDPEKVLKTIQNLFSRISERFPQSGLSRVCRELETACSRSTAKIESIERPLWSLRVLRYVLVLGMILGMVLGFLALKDLDKEVKSIRKIDLIQTIEAALNDLVMVAVALFFVWSLEARVKRRRAMRALHELRSIAHVIDMHQLTKDPERLNESYKRTDSSPVNGLTAYEMRRYLDYCAEMLSLTGKVAALYLRTLDDVTVVAAVNEIEDLTTGLSSKIWQKIALMQA